MSTITIKSQGDSINILVDDNADLEVITEDLRKKVSDAKQFFEGASSNIAFKGRKLTKKDEKMLLDIITTETTMSVTLVDGEQPIASPSANTKNIAKPDKIIEEKVEPTVPKVTQTAQTMVNYITSNTAYYQIGLRSGQSIKFAGSVVVLGDANPGSEIVADGNVIVLGALKGMAHAGANGDTDCFVSALQLQPTQLRIANIITHVPPPPKGKKEQQKPSIAFVNDGKVFVGPM